MKRIALALVALSTLAACSSFAAPQDPKPEGKIQKRKENQQKRIAEGVENGSLNAKETANLEHKEAKLNQQIHKERVANGGNLTNKENKQINRKQNKLSKDIYAEKHDKH